VLVASPRSVADASASELELLSDEKSLEDVRTFGAVR